MDNKQESRLMSLLTKRREMLESIRHFDEYFERFARFILREVVEEINHKLFDYTNESLRVFYEDPYENVRSRYFVMVQLISENQKRNHFFLDNTKDSPSITFEGDEITGRLKVTTKYKENKTINREIEVGSLQPNQISEVIIDFLEKTYN